MLFDSMSTREVATVLLIRRLYIDLGKSTGGPLHDVLDDNNAYDDCIRDTPCRYRYLWDGRYEQWAQAGDDTSVEHRGEIQRTCEAILAALRDMEDEDSRYDWVDKVRDWINDEMWWRAQSWPRWLGERPTEPPPRPTAEQMEAATLDMDALLAAVPCRWPVEEGACT